MKQIEQTYTIKSPLDKVWWALTTAEGGEKWGAGLAKFDAKEGGKFSYWGGDIHGTNTKVIPEQLLEQDWYGHDHPDWKYKVTFTFNESDDWTTVHLLFKGEIEDEQKDIKDWQDYYFTPIKKLLEKS